MRRLSIRVIPARLSVSTPRDDKNSDWEMLEKLLKFLPIMTICAFVLGFLKVDSYYKSFNINILNYISAPELLFSLFPLSTSIILGFYFPLYMGMISHNLVQVRWFPKWRFPGYIGPVIILIWIAVFTYLGYFLPVHSPFYRNTPIYREAAWGFPALDIFYTYIRSKKGMVSGIDVIIPIVLLGYGLYSFGTYEGSVVKVKGADKSYIFKWKDKLIKSDSASFMVGDIQNYVILYHPKDSSTVVYKRTEIDSLVIRPVP